MRYSSSLYGLMQSSSACRSSCLVTIISRQLVVSWVISTGRTIGGIAPRLAPLVPHEPERYAFDLLNLAAAHAPAGPEPFCAVPGAHLLDGELHSITPQQAVSYGGNGLHWFTRYRPGRADDEK